MKRREEERFENNAQAEFAPSRERSNGRKIERSHLCEARRRGKEALKEKDGEMVGGTRQGASVSAPLHRGAPWRDYFSN